MNPNHFLMIIAALVTYWVVTIYQPFLLDMAIAGLLAVATANMHGYFFRRTGNDIAAAALSTSLMAIILFGPIIYFIITISSVIATIDPALIPQIIQKLLDKLDNAPEYLSFLEPKIKAFLQELEVMTVSQNVLSFFGNIGAKSAVFMKDIVLIIVFYFFANYYGKQLLFYLKETLPFEEEKAIFLFNETSLVMSVTTYSIIVTAVFEGALFGLAVLFLGYDPILFGILYGFASLIPIVGGMLMWVPLALFELYLGNVAAAVFVSLYTVLVISVVADTFVKPVIIEVVNKRLLGKQTKVNSIIIFFAIVAGLSTHGFWGMIIGPAVTALFIAILSVLGSLRNSNI